MTMDTALSPQWSWESHRLMSPNRNLQLDQAEVSTAHSWSVVLGPLTPFSHVALASKHMLS